MNFVNQVKHQILFDNTLISHSKKLNLAAKFTFHFLFQLKKNSYLRLVITNNKAYYYGIFNSKMG
ncbi:hypothetical protein GCM10023210_41600 [Chryseobacterium ginsengisoli]|uniref:Uncharacterized protein n=1 Tax=Chryseobacterium ginsengisoli TaxID=363853 RepID=A0ABP9MTE5_9FLAO